MSHESQGMSFPPEFRIAEKYKIIRSIGKGSFGEVFLGQDIVTKNQVAIKIEESRQNFSQLLFESKVYRYLSDGVNIPAARLYVIDEVRRALVMELLGPSLEDLHRKCSRRFSLKSVCLLADQMLSLLEYLHIRCIIHRDIKPDNFLMGVSEPTRVYIVDFGLAKQYCISRLVPHVKYNNRKSMIGTARYASINAHLGIEQSRRDDLESLGYVLLYFLLGQLPWQGIQGVNKSRRYDRICEKKLTLSPDIVCRSAPTQFRHYLSYSHHLRFDQKPDYMYLRQLFRTVMQLNNLRFDNIFDWASTDTFFGSPRSDHISQPAHHQRPHLPPPQIQIPQFVSPQHIRLPANTQNRGLKINQHFISQNEEQNNKTKLPPPGKRHTNQVNSKPKTQCLSKNTNQSLESPSVPRYNLRSQKREEFKNSELNKNKCFRGKVGGVPKKQFS